MTLIMPQSTLIGLAARDRRYRGPRRTQRKLRLETLESRTMLAAAPFAPDWVAEFPVEPPYGPSGLRIRDSAVDVGGNLIVFGEFGGTVDFDPGPGTHNLSSTFSLDLFVAKYNSSGAFVAAADIGDVDWRPNGNRALTVDTSGAVYVSAGYVGAATMMNGQILPAPQSNDEAVLIAKLDSSLQTMDWASHATLGGWGPYGRGEIRIQDIAVDAGGTSVYASGIIVGKGTIGGIDVKLDLDGFVSRLDATTGSFQWVEALRGVGWLDGVAVDPTDAGSVYVYEIRNCCNEPLVIRLDTAGNIIWQKAFSNNVSWSGIAANSGGIYLAGSFSGQTSIDQITLVSAGNSDALVARLDPTGSVTWATQAGGAENDSATQLAVDSSGNLFLAGALDGIAAFGNDILAESSSSDSYISQLDGETGSFLQSWRYGPARVDDLAAGAGSAFAYGIHFAPGADFPNGYFPSVAPPGIRHIMHFAPAADPTIPRINGFVAAPDPVEQGNPLTLSILGLFDPAVRVDSVVFYYDVNTDRRLDVGIDVLVGVDTDGSDGWSTVASTGTLPFGDHQFLAQAAYDGGALSLVASSAPVLVSTALTYVSSDVGKQIRDLKTVVSTLNVPDSFTIADVDVTLSIRHTHNADLDVYLIHPDGTRVELFTDVGGIANTNDNMLNTTLDDQANTSINSGTAPFTGTFRPEGLLSVLNGKDSAGVWRLEVTDDARKDTGTLDAWSLTISAASSAAAATTSA